jgi:hypothetical protein
MTDLGLIGFCRWIQSIGDDLFHPPAGAVHKQDANSWKSRTFVTSDILKQKKNQIKHEK